MSYFNALFIAGTDTDAGKTVLTTALAAYWQKYCPQKALGIMKPIQTGVGDRELYTQLFDLDPATVTPLHFQAPLAPPIAADHEGRTIELERAWQGFNALHQEKDWVLVESLGSLGSPITHEMTVADLAWDWRLPVLLVVPVRLGAIGQAIAHVALARQSRIHLKGIVLNCPHPCTDQQIADWASPDLIQSLTQTSVLGILPYLAEPTNLDHLAQAAANLNLERFMPLDYSFSEPAIAGLT